MRKRFIEHEAGGVALLYAILAPVFCLSAAVTVDVGTFYLQKRALQGATDLAAVAAAQNPGKALVSAQQNLILNGFQASAVQSAQLGTYTPNSDPSVALWFTPGLGSAVQVTSKIQAPFYFATIMNMMTQTPCKTSPCDTATITATATASFDPQANFAVGSGLASLNGGVLNSVLGALLGANVSFSLMDYQALASANVSLFAFSNALATRLNLTGVSYNDLAAMQVSEPVVLQALADAARVGSSTSVVNDLNTLASLAPSSQTVAMGQLLSFGEFGALKVNSPAPIVATADALDMVSGVLQIANGQHQVQTALAVNLAPIASATLALSIGERPVGSGFVSIGSTGATVHTAQTRLLLTLQIAQIGSAATINLPIYIELASATASLLAINCSVDPTQQSATLAVTPAVVDAWIGAVGAAAMTDFTTKPSPAPAALLSVAGIAVTGRAHATLTNLSATSVTFTYNDIVDDNRKTTSTTDFTSSLLYNLFANLSLGASLGGLSISTPASLTSSMGSTLALATAPIDQIIGQVLNGLGLSLGDAYTWVSGVKCGSAKLVL